MPLFLKVLEKLPVGTQWVFQDLPSITFTNDENAPSSPVNGGILNEEYDCLDGRITGSSVDTALNRLCFNNDKENDDGSIQIDPDENDIDIVEDGLNIDGGAVITKNTDGSIQIGTDGNDIDITSEGLNIDGNPLITPEENGEIHIGKNPW